MDRSDFHSPMFTVQCFPARLTEPLQTGALVKKLRSLGALKPRGHTVTIKALPLLPLTSKCHTWF